MTNDVIKRLVAHIRANWFCVCKFFRSGEVWQVITFAHEDGSLTHIAAWRAENSQVKVFWRHPLYDN